MKRNIAIGSDHAGFNLKTNLITWLQSIGYEVDDNGCYSEERADYPDFAHSVANKVINGQNITGILICGSGNGIAMAANKHNGIRAAICWNRELAELARLHNNANVLVLPARFISNEEALACAQVFLNTGFEGGRHSGRVEKIDFAC